MTERQKAYQEFLQSEFWKTIRQQCKDRANRRCEDCKAHGVRFHAHHTSYPEDWYKTTLEQLRCLCDRCHRKTHGLPVAEPTRKKTIRKANRKTARHGKPKPGPIAAVPVQNRVIFAVKPPAKRPVAPAAQEKPKPAVQKKLDPKWIMPAYITGGFIWKTVSPGLPADTAERVTKPDHGQVLSG